MVKSEDNVVNIVLSICNIPQVDKVDNFAVFNVNCVERQ